MFVGMNSQGMPPSALQSQGVPPVQVSSQGMMAPVLAPSIPGKDTAAGPAACRVPPGQEQMPIKFDIGQILSVIRNNMSANPQNNE